MKKIIQVSCSGGINSESKHPLIYLHLKHLNSEKETACPYCSKTFSIEKKQGKKPYIEACETEVIRK